MGLAAYLREFKIVWSVLTSIFFLGPIWMQLIQVLTQYNMSPPFQPMFIIMAIIFLMFVPLVIFQFRNHSLVSKKWRGISILTLLLLAILFFIFYAFFLNAVVRSGTAPDGTTLRLVIGLKRSELAEKQFPRASDEEILSDLGWSEEGVRKGWIPWTISLAQVLLWLFYLCIFLSVVSLFSLVVLFDFVDSLSPST